MASPPLNDDDILQVTFYCGQGDQIGLNVRHYQYQGGGLVNELLQDAANNIDAHFAPLYRAYLPQDAFWLGVGVRRLAPLAGPSYYSVSVPLPGLIVSDVLPRQVSGIITLQTDFGGPGGRGRAYLPFPAKLHDDATIDGPTAAYIVLAVPLANAFQQAAIVGTAGNFTLNGLVRHTPTGGVITENRLITTVKVRQKWATQRRRGTYGSANLSPF